MADTFIQCARTPVPPVIHGKTCRELQGDVEELQHDVGNIQTDLEGVHTTLDGKSVVSVEGVDQTELDISYDEDNYKYLLKDGDDTTVMTIPEGITYLDVTLHTGSWTCDIDEKELYDAVYHAYVSGMTLSTVVFRIFYQVGLHPVDSVAKMTAYLANVTFVENTNYRQGTVQAVAFKGTQEIWVFNFVINATSYPTVTVTSSVTKYNTYKDTYTDADTDGHIVITRTIT